MRRARVNAGVVCGVLVALVAGGSGPVQLEAQRAGGAGYFGAGISALDTGGLDARLAAQGYPTFGRAALAIGGGAHRVYAGGLVIGGEGYGLLLGEQAHDGRSVVASGGYGVFKLGYIVAASDRARLYPTAGIGGGGLTLRLGSRPEVASFDAVLANPDRQALLARGSLVVDLGAAVEITPGRAARGPVIGARAGYLFAPLNAAWRQDGFVVADGPDARLTGPYVRATIGGGRRR